MTSEPILAQERVYPPASLPVILQAKTNGATTSYLYGLDLLSATDNNGVRTYFLQDGLGSTTGLTDGTS
jgi:hypothetical protein